MVRSIFIENFNLYFVETFYSLFNLSYSCFNYWSTINWIHDLFSFFSSIGDLSTSTNEQLDWTTRLHIALNASQGNDLR